MGADSQITGWTLSDASRNLWSAPVPAGLDTRQLYVNGVRAEVAQGPSSRSRPCRPAWPVERDGLPDNTVADGQLVTVSGSGNTLGFLFVGITGNPPISDTGSVLYTDGTAQTFTLSSPNWYGSPSAGADAPFVLPYRNFAGGQDHDPVAIYYQGVPLTTGKTIASVVLPVSGSGPDPALHIVAMAAGNVACLDKRPGHDTIGFTIDGQCG